jgi:hypothetical protein
MHMMEGLFVLALFVALAILSLRYGVDSRDGLRSKEHDLAARGVTWTDPTDQPRSGGQPRVIEAPTPAYRGARAQSAPVAASGQGIVLTSGR